MKTLILILFSSACMAQNPWKITGNDFAVIGTQLVSGASDGFNQKVAHHHYGQGKKFWDDDVSWKNKYRDWDAGDHRAAFPGSKTWLVFATDGFHLTRTIDRFATLATIGITAGELRQYDKKDRWKVMVKKIVLSAISNRLMFTLIYK